VELVTVEKDWPRPSALAARGERIVAVGSEGDVGPYIGPQTCVLDLQGRLAVPGFIEGHGHLMRLGDSKAQLDLGGAEVSGWDGRHTRPWSECGRRLRGRRPA